MELTTACRRSLFLVVLFVCSVAGIAMAQQDGGWSCGTLQSFSPQIPVNPTDTVHMVYLFGWMPSDTEPMPKMKPLPSWFYSFMDTTSTGWKIKSLPRWFRDMSYDPSLGGSRHIIYGNAYGANNNTYYYRPDSTWRYYSHFTGWYGQFQLDIIKKADQDIDFSQFTGPGTNDTVVEECCFFDKDNIRQGSWYDNQPMVSGVADVGFGTYVTNDYKNGCHVIVQQGTSLRSINEWGIPPGWPDQEQRNALGSGAHEYMHHFSNGSNMNHQYDDEGNGLSAPGRDYYNETVSWAIWGTYAPGFGWGFVGEADPFMKQWNNWGTPVEVDTIRYLQHIHDLVTTGEMFKLPINNPPGGREQYFLVTNHQRISAWEDTFPGKGIVINHVVPWHANRYGQIGNSWEMQKMTDVEAATGLWDSTGAGKTACPDSGWDAPDFYSGDTSFNRSHNANQGAKADLYSDQQGYGFTIFDGLSNPNSNAYDINYSGWYDEGKYPQNSVTHLAVYNIHQDPSDSAVMIADLLTNNWYGHITQNTTWGPGHYVITGDVTVDPGVKLTIAQGTTIDFYPQVNNQITMPPFIPAGIYVKGKLTAIGSSSQPIVFRSNASLRGGTPSNSDWQGIYLGHGSTDTLKYCQISDCYYGVWADSATALACSCNAIQNVLTYGIKLTNVPSGTRIMRNRILHPSPTYGVYVERTNAVTPAAWQIAYNYIEMSTYGIYVSADSMGSNALTIYQDTLYYPSQIGGATACIHLEGTKSAVRIRRCRIDQGAGGNAGIECVNRVWPVIDSTKMRGIFQPNVWPAYGIYINNPNGVSSPRLNIYQDSLGNFNTGVYVGNCTSNPPMLGDGSPPYPGQSNFDGIVQWYLYNVGSSLPPTIMAKNNWWGSNPPNSTKFYGPNNHIPFATSRFSQPWICSEPGGGNATQTAELLESLFPTKFELGQSYPNPANGGITIRYALPQEARVSLKIYNVAGQLVKCLVAEAQPAGYHSILWDGKSESGLPAGLGVYLYRMVAGSFTSTKKLVLAR